MSEKEFAEIYNGFWKKLYGVAYSYVRDKATAQELVQDVFVKLWMTRGEIGELNNADAYLFKCLKNKIYDHFDKVSCREKHRKHALENFTEGRHMVDESVAFNETMNAVNEELEKLPAKTRAIFRMSKFDQYTTDEIATEMRVSAKAVEYHMTKALKKIRLRLAIFLS